MECQYYVLHVSQLWKISFGHIDVHYQQLQLVFSSFLYKHFCIDEKSWNRWNQAGLRLGRGGDLAQKKKMALIQFVFKGVPVNTWSSATENRSKPLCLTTDAGFSPTGHSMVSISQSQANVDVQ